VKYYPKKQQKKTLNPNKCHLEGLNGSFGGVFHPKCPKVGGDLLGHPPPELADTLNRLTSGQLGQLADYLREWAYRADSRGDAYYARICRRAEGLVRDWGTP